MPEIRYHQRFQAGALWNSTPARLIFVVKAAAHDFDDAGVDAIDRMPSEVNLAITACADRMPPVLRIRRL